MHKLIPKSVRALRLLLLKPYQHEPNLMVYSPPLGLLSLIACIRERFEGYIEIKLVDLKVRHLPAEHVQTLLDEFHPDVVGLSALNCEAGASRAIAELCKKFDPAIITVMGGPYALHRSEEILNTSPFDWVFDGPADNTFPEALYRYSCGDDLDNDWGKDLKGFSYRTQDGGLHLSGKQDSVDDLDSLPRPAWDLIDFNLYANKTRFGAMAKTSRYAMLFTSRGCPYLCHYCHDIFTKKYVYQSVEGVIADIEHLYSVYGISEFQIVDDIFNLHKPRLRAIMDEVARRWPGQLHFSFPNGLRGDILDAKTIKLLCDAGTYAATIAVETVTPRLQALIEKDLDFDKARWAIAEFNKYDVVVAGFFMLGFPTETREELQATIDFALESELTLANFFTVTPQPKTPLYLLAEKESKAALERVTQMNESGGGSHRSGSWYQEAHNYPLDQVVRKTIFRFYANPRRIWRIWRRVPKRVLWSSIKLWWNLTVIGQNKNPKVDTLDTSETGDGKSVAPG